MEDNQGNKKRAREEAEDTERCRSGHRTSSGDPVPDDGGVQLLGLPPSFPSVEEEQKFETVFDVEEGGVGFGEMMGNEFPIPIYDSFEFGIGGDSDTNNNIPSNSGDFVTLGGLFEPTADISELTWRHESLSAL
ncbi:hypothetical protein V6N11_014979 [Hibiscus sabdariffa]|uniref:Uncharacterized protein n=1 Tax=Hibiscus sabdariffa TaxID=183260 RepID=A0ABR2TQQ2_9ROSI